MEGIYTVKDMAKMLSISIGAVRKWEDDYNLKIPRNEMGHRFYTTKELEIFQRIIKLKNEGANIHLIRKVLAKDGIIEELQEDNLPITPIEKLSLEEFEDNIVKKMGEYILHREQELKKEFEDKLGKVKDEILDKQQEQIQGENRKLMDYLAITREEDKKKAFLLEFLANKKHFSKNFIKIDPL